MKNIIICALSIILLVLSLMLAGVLPRFRTVYKNPKIIFAKCSHGSKYIYPVTYNERGDPEIITPCNHLPQMEIYSRQRNVGDMWCTDSKCSDLYLETDSGTNHYYRADDNKGKIIVQLYKIGEDSVGIRFKPNNLWR